jgi:hypothetical protein
MPSRTRTPDLPAVSGRVTPSATTEPAGPPDSDKASETNGTGTGREPAWNGPRLVRVPDGWPPYDCETHGAACSAAPEAGRQPPRPAAVSETAAVGETTGEAAAIGEAAAAWNTVSASAGMTVGTAEAGTGRTAGLGPAPGRPAGPGSAAGPNGGAGHAPGLSAAWPRQFAQVLVEILAGFRPAKQLAPWATEQVRAQIDLLSCAADAEQRPRIRRVMTSRPTAGVVEMTMVVGFGPRSRALAMRFEHVPARPPVPGRPPRPARWLCTEIETS